MREALKGAEESGASVLEVFLPDYRIEYCRDCRACLTTGRCVVQDLGQIAEALVLEEGKLVTLLRAAQSTLSLDGPVMNLGSSEPFGACLEDRSVPGPEEVVVGASLRSELDSALAGLSAREANILRDRFGLAGNARISLLEAGRKHGLSKERVRQIEKKALRKIRASEVYAN